MLFSSFYLHDLRIQLLFLLFTTYGVIALLTYCLFSPFFLFVSVLYFSFPFVSVLFSFLSCPVLSSPLYFSSASNCCTSTRPSLGAFRLFPPAFFCLSFVLFSSYSTYWFCRFIATKCSSCSLKLICPLLFLICSPWWLSCSSLPTTWFPVFSFCFFFSYSFVRFIIISPALCFYCHSISFLNPEFVHFS